MSDVVDNKMDLTAVKVIGFSGDRGKLTASRFCDSVLRAAGFAPHSLSSLRFGSCAPNLYKVLEAGNEAIAVALPSARPQPLDVAIFTGLRPECIDARESFEALSPAIEDFFRGLDHSKDRVPFAVVNRDDFFGVGLVEAVKVPHISYGTGPGAHVRATQIQLGNQRSSYTLETPLGAFTVQLKMSSHFNVLHSLAAIAMGLALRIDLEVILPAIEAVEAYHGRYEVSMADTHESLDRAA